MRLGQITTMAGLCAMVGCAGGGAEPDRVLVTDSLGTQITQVSDRDLRLEWEFEENWRVGGEDDGPTAFTQIGLGSVVAAEGGGMWVLDRSAHRVVAFSSSGGVLRVLGGEGQGPGELSFPTSVAALQDESIWVYDIGAGGVVRYGEAGSALPRIRVEGYNFTGLVRAGASGVHMLLRDPGTDSLRQFIALADSVGTTEMVRLPALAAPRQIQVPGCQVSIPLSEIYAPSVRWDGWLNRVVVTVGPEYVIDVYEDGVHVMSLRRDVALAPVTETMAIDHYPDGFTIGLPGGACTAEAAPMVRAQGYAPVVPALANVRIAPSGEIWARRFNDGVNEGLIDVWSPGGSYTGTLAGARLPVAFLTDGRVVTVERDSFDVPELVVWTVRR